MRIMHPLYYCPNCDAAMNCPDDPCPECSHNGGDSGCECQYCENSRVDETDEEEEQPDE